MIKPYIYQLFGCCQRSFASCFLCLYDLVSLTFAKLFKHFQEMRTTDNKGASPGTIQEGLRLTPQLSAEQISHQSAGLTCVVSIST